MFRLFVRLSACLPACLLACLVVSSRELFTASGRATTITAAEVIKQEALPLRMTPPWPFSTSPHCASTEPCGDIHSLGRAGEVKPLHPHFPSHRWRNTFTQLSESPGNGGVHCAFFFFFLSFCVMLLWDIQEE